MDGLQGCSLLLDLDGTPKEDRYSVMAVYKGVKESCGVYLKIDDWDAELGEPKPGIIGYALKVRQIQLACGRLVNNVFMADLHMGSTAVDAEWIDEPSDVLEKKTHKANFESDEPVYSQAVSNTDRYHYPQVPMYIQNATFVTDCTQSVDMGGYLYKQQFQPMIWPTVPLEPWNIAEIKQKPKAKVQRKPTKPTVEQHNTDDEIPVFNRILCIKFRSKIKFCDFWSDKDGMKNGLKNCKALFRRYRIPHIYPTLYKGRADKNGCCYVYVRCSHKNSHWLRTTGVCLPFDQWDWENARPLPNLPNYAGLMKLIGRTMREVFNTVIISEK